MINITVPERRIERIIRRIEANPDGVSLNPDASLPDLSDGFIVALTNNIVDKITPKEIRGVQIQLQNSSLAKLIGSWYSPVTKAFYVDISLNVPELETAVAIAREHSQEAIYDVSRQQSLYLAKLRGSFAGLRGPLAGLIWGFVKKRMANIKNSIEKIKKNAKLIARAAAEADKPLQLQGGIRK